MLKPKSLTLASMEELKEPVLSEHLIKLGYGAGNHIVIYPERLSSLEQTFSRFTCIGFVEGRRKRRLHADWKAAVTEFETRYGAVNTVRFFSTREAAEDAFPELL